MEYPTVALRTDRIGSRSSFGLTLGEADKQVVRSKGVGENSYRSSVVKVLAGLAAYPWALGNSSTIAMLRSIVAIIIVTASFTGCESRLCVRAAPITNIGLPVGSEFQLTAGTLDILHECDRPRSARTQWESTNPTIAVIDKDGVLRGVAPGQMEVVARSGGGEVRTPVTIVPRIDRITLTPGDTTVTIGDTVTFRVLAYGQHGDSLPQIRIGVRTTEWLSSEGPLGQIHPPVPSRDRGSNSVSFVARAVGATHVVAYMIGRADSVMVRTRDR